MAPTDAAWKDIRSLQTLMMYWADHTAEFADQNQRGAAVDAAALAIKESSGEDISSKQIMKKFYNMWERKRTVEFEEDTGGTKRLFEIGPRCLNREKLGLTAIEVSAPETRPRPNNRVQVVIRSKPEAVS